MGVCARNILLHVRFFIKIIFHGFNWFLSNLTSDKSFLQTNFGYRFGNLQRWMGYSTHSWGKDCGRLSCLWWSERLKLFALPKTAAWTIGFAWFDVRSVTHYESNSCRIICLLEDLRFISILYLLFDTDGLRRFSDLTVQSHQKVICRGSVLVLDKTGNNLFVALGNGISLSAR